MKKLFYLLNIVLFVFFGCNKDTNSPITINTGPPEIIQYDLGDSSSFPSRMGNLINTVIDSNKVTLQYSGTPPQFHSNYYIVDTVGNGYCRQITSIQNQGNTVVLQTTDAFLTRVFKNLNIQKKIHIKPTYELNQRIGNSLKPIDTSYNIIVIKGSVK